MNPFPDALLIYPQQLQKRFIRTIMAAEESGGSQYDSDQFVMIMFNSLPQEAINASV
jgi:hypothetical protein